MTASYGYLDERALPEHPNLTEHRSKRSRTRSPLLGGEGLGYVFGVGAGLDEVLGYAGALFVGEGGDGGEDAAESNGYVVDVVHEANGFSGEGHVLGSSIRVEFSFYCKAKGRGNGKSIPQGLKPGFILVGLYVRAKARTLQRWSCGSLMYALKHVPFKAKARGV
jgi:hypothetical protein